MLAAVLAGLVLVAAALTLAVFVLIGAKAASLAPERELRARVRPDDLEGFPLVSVIVPARNEERSIGRCLATVLSFDYPSFEVIVADDGSTDRTAEIVLEVARADGRGRVRLVPQDPGVEGERASWRSGKSFVLARAAKHAQGEWLLFVDADTRHEADGLWRAMALARSRGVAAVSCSGVYVNPGFWGDLIEALLYTATFLVMPLGAINDRARRHIGWMNGQFILIERQRYEEVGGHAAIRGFSFDDMSMARLLKERGVPYVFLPGAQLFECRNYVGLAEAHRGWVRLLAGGTPWLGLGRGFFLLAPLVIALTCVVPWLVLAAAAAGLVEPFAIGGASLAALAAGQAAFATVVFALNRVGMKLPAWPAVLLPIAAALAIRVFVQGYRARFGHGSVDFRGRSIGIDEDPSSLAAAR